MTENLDPKLSDFGLAKMLGMEESKVFTDVRGTIGYMDPEYMTNAKLRFWPLSIATGDKTGRLLQYDPCTKKVTVLLDNLAFANGVALSKDSSFLLVAESATSKIFKL